MGEHLIISINREFGAGGLEVAGKIADRLGVHAYDEDIAGLAAKRSGIRKDYFTKVDEKPTDSFLYMLAMNTFSINSGSVTPFDNTLSSDKLFNLQSEVIREIAEKEDCVIVGRCGGYILRNEPKLVRVYLTASREFRKERVINTYHYDAKEAEKIMTQTDKRRDSYFGYYASQDWRAAASYDLCLNTSVLGIDRTVEVILDYIKTRFA